MVDHLHHRSVEPELLDHLAPDDPLAVASREDLYRLNRIMRSPVLVARLLATLPAGTLAPTLPLRILELGSGDGRVMLSVARRLAATWPPVGLTLLDRQPVITADSMRAFENLGWRIDIVQADALPWLRASSTHWDLVVCNLFAHHFCDAALRTLLQTISERTRVFLACEPRRAWLPLFASHLVFVTGANAITRTDAVLSVRAGFRARELSALWPRAAAWTTREGPAGLFSHYLLASGGAA